MEANIGHDGSFLVPASAIREAGILPGARVQIQSFLGQISISLASNGSYGNGDPFHHHNHNHQQRKSQETQTFQMNRQSGFGGPFSSSSSSFMMPHSSPNRPSQHIHQHQGNLPFVGFGDESNTPASFYSQEKNIVAPSVAAASSAAATSSTTGNNSNSHWLWDSSDFWNTSNPFSSSLPVAQNPPQFMDEHGNGSGSKSLKRPLHSSQSHLQQLLAPIQHNQHQHQHQFDNNETLQNSYRSLTDSLTSGSSKTTAKQRTGNCRRNEPKRNISSYSIFTKYISKQLSAENPGIDFQERGRLTAERWRTLSEAERKPFVLAAELDRRRYRNECVEYRGKKTIGVKSSVKGSDIIESSGPPPTHRIDPATLMEATDDPNEFFLSFNLLYPSLPNSGSENGGTGTGGGSGHEIKRRHKSVGPKRTISAFKCFTKEMTPLLIEQNPQISFQDRARLISKKWKELSEEEKSPYLELESMDKIRYRNECETFLDHENPTKPTYRKWTRELRMKPLEEYNLDGVFEDGDDEDEDENVNSEVEGRDEDEARFEDENEETAHFE